jgi:hypothetical protein
MTKWIGVGCLAFALLGGCGGGLQLRLVDGAHRRPSNVAVFFAVEDSDGEPVADLLASDFRIYEDGELVSLHESRQTIVNPEVASVHYTLLLVDMSASVTESEQAERVVQAARSFVEKVGPTHKVALYAFDGSQRIYKVAAFSKPGDDPNALVSKLQGFRGQDPSTNLHGAVTRALEELDDAVERDKTPLRFGTLVVFTDGTDRASRVSREDMAKAVEESEHEIFAIGVGAEIDDNTLSDIGRTGHIRVGRSEEMAEAFGRIGERVYRAARRYYLLSYCSPARANKHKVTIEAHKDGASGSLTYDFDAKGFRPQCDASQPPPFDTSGRTARARKKLEAASDPDSEQ